jgi:hypothetical protein
MGRLASVVVLVAVSACGPELATRDAMPQADGDANAEAEYGACLDAHGELDHDACDPEVGDACIRSATIAGVNVCASPCEADSDCAEGDDASSACRGDLVAGTAVCVLECTAQTCPSGMVCSAGMCAWVPQR